MKVYMVFWGISLLAMGACSKSSSAPPLVSAAADKTNAALSAASVSTAYAAKVDTGPQLQARMDAYKGALPKFMHACLFKDQVTQAFVDAIREAVAGTSGTCEDAAGKLDTQPILRQELNSKGLTEISLLQEFTFLKELNLSGNSIVDLSPLAALTQLTYLDVSNNAVVDITPLQSLDQLTELDMINNKIVALDALYSLPKITVLRMSSNYISNISSVRGMTGLIEGDFAKNTIQNLDPLQKLTSLQRLYLDENHVISVAPLSGLTQLQELTLSQSETYSSSLVISTDTDTGVVSTPPAQYKINTISALSGLTKLQKLTLRNNNLEDINIVGKMPILITLDASNNNLSVANFLQESADKSTCTCSLGALKTLDLSGNRFSDVDMLRVCATSLHMNFTYSPQGGTH